MPEVHTRLNYCFKRTEQGPCGDGGGTGGDKLPTTHGHGGRHGGSAPKKSRKQARWFTADETKLLESLYTDGNLSNVPSKEATAATISAGCNPMSEEQVGRWVKKSAD